MNFKNLVLASIAVVCVLIVVIFAIQERDSITYLPEKELFFPDLIDQVNDINEIRVRSAQGEAVVQLLEGDWRVQQQNLYSADFNLVRSIIIELSQLQKLEKKTSDENLHSELDLAGVNADNSATVQIQLVSVQGKVLADLLLGKKKAAIEDSLYVRQPGQTQTWLTETALEVPTNSFGWINLDLVNIESQRVSEVSLSVPRQQEVRVYKSKFEDKNFQLMGIPEGYQIRHQFLINNIGKFLKDLKFESVVKISDWQSSGELTVRTFDDLMITVSFGTGNLSNFAIFEASTSEGASSQILDEAMRLNDKWHSWAYQLPDVRTKLAQTTFEDLIQLNTTTEN